MTFYRNTCGTCKYFTFKGSTENEKGYCSWYGTYYYPDESMCSHAKDEDE